MWVLEHASGELCGVGGLCWFGRFWELGPGAAVVAAAEAAANSPGSSSRLKSQQQQQAQPLGSNRRPHTYDRAQG